MNKYQQEFNDMKRKIDNYTKEEVLDSYKTLTGLEQEEMSIEEIRLYLKKYWKEQIYKDVGIIVN